ncbi:DUF2489 domain-containing protein [Spartinivicinus poritis]|uniref:DUF2489 domain-containing protein n=1 Tax=Spartinivicinus poritis TaxID=2994640 RepID=A0ABT5UA22_9GAMM|nr:DUF2489 domain-containing protein [Spartinivicinus sp. A2-2]MDE1461984.1 DUF2489 domain-containing protein [Spartinivicinus sp. A2-2]
MLYTNIFLIFGILIILGLSAWAVILWREVFANQAKLKQFEKQQKDFLASSVKILALAIANDQLDLTEGAIRLKILLDNIDVNLVKQPDLAVFDTIYNATKHMATHDAREAMQLSLKIQQDSERTDLEEQYGEAIKAAAKKLLSTRF